MSTPFSISVQVVAFVLTFLLTLITGPIIIPILKRLKVGQTVRNDGPATHLKKSGTPLMGGIIFLVPILLVSIFYAGEYPQILPVVLTSIGFGIVGFMDDYIKVVKKNKDGLNPRQKMLGIFIVAVLFAVYAAFYTDAGREMTIPFIAVDIPLSLWFFIPFTILLLLYSTNAVNLTDGIDGLAAGTTLIVMVFFTIVAMSRSEWEYVKIFSAVTAGGCLGFLTYNIHPAKVFMGDTGSLALGGAVGAAAVIMKVPLVLFIVGIVYLAEILSDIIQVTSFKMRGKRVFRMAPIHHHFELSGWKETRVVAVFWIITVVFCVIGLFSLHFKII